MVAVKKTVSPRKKRVTKKKEPAKKTTKKTPTKNEERTSGDSTAIATVIINNVPTQKKSTTKKPTEKKLSPIEQVQSMQRLYLTSGPAPVLQIGPSQTDILRRIESKYQDQQDTLTARLRRLEIAEGNAVVNTPPEISRENIMVGGRPVDAPPASDFGTILNFSEMGMNPSATMMNPSDPTIVPDDILFPEDDPALEERFVDPTLREEDELYPEDDLPLGFNLNTPDLGLGSTQQRIAVDAAAPEIEEISVLDDDTPAREVLDERNIRNRLPIIPQKGWKSVQVISGTNTTTYLAHPDFREGKWTGQGAITRIRNQQEIGNITSSPWNTGSQGRVKPPSTIKTKKGEVVVVNTDNL